MKYNSIYIEGLIRKYLLRQLTAEEGIALEKERAGMAEDEYDRLVVEVLRRMESELAIARSVNWSPDYSDIRRREQAVLRRRRWRYLKKVTPKAAFWVAIIGFSAFVFVLRYQGDDVQYGGLNCGYLTKDTEIPVSESAGSIWVGDSLYANVEDHTLGEIIVVGNLRISRTAEGALQIRRTTVANLQENSSPVIIRTATRQQCVLYLDNGTSIRLNAQSYVHISPAYRKGASLVFGGEAHVKATGKRNALVLQTNVGRVSARDAEFVVRSVPGETKALLRSGELQLTGTDPSERLDMICPYDLGVIRTVPANGSVGIRDTLLYAANVDFESAITWTRAKRTYKDMPLRAYVEEMSRWDGFKINDWKCLPQDKKVTVDVCYKDGTDEILATIRGAGVVLYENKGLISFCPEQSKKWSGLHGDGSLLAWHGGTHGKRE